MNSKVDSTDRSTGEFITFAVSFYAFLTALTGVVLGSRCLSILGFLVLLLAILSFSFRSSDAG